MLAHTTIMMRLTPQFELHLICRKRHLPLKGKTIGCGKKFSIALTYGAAHTVYSIVPNRATAKTVSTAASIRH